jgi:hypothetical protein
MPEQNAQNTTPLRCRIPDWMAKGLEEVAKKHRVDNVSLVTRWAIEDMLKREGVLPDAEPTAA